MKTSLTTTLKNRGSSLIEAVIAMGVLAVAVPLVFGAIAESGKSGISAEADTRSTWIIPACMNEIRASREGKPQFFIPTLVGQTFPPTGDVWALAFSPEGKPVGKLSKTAYESGAKDLNGQAIGYVTTLSSVTTTTKTGATPMLRAKVTLEYPAGAPLAKRQKLDFFTRIP